MTNNIDIVEQLREEGFITHIGGLPRESKLLHEAADKIEQLREERDEAMALVETIVHNVDVLSTRPAAAIKLNDLVDRINEWGDAARKILKESSDE